MFRNRTLRLILMVWAVVLGFGISYALAEREALHDGCFDTCEADCGAGNCAAAFSDGCSCVWRCSGGGGGSSICS